MNWSDVFWFKYILLICIVWICDLMISCWFWGMICIRVCVGEIIVCFVKIWLLWIIFFIGFLILRFLSFFLVECLCVCKLIFMNLSFFSVMMVFLCCCVVRCIVLILNVEIWLFSCVLDVFKLLICFFIWVYFFFSDDICEDVIRFLILSFFVVIRLLDINCNCVWSVLSCVFKFEIWIWVWLICLFSCWSFFW